MQQRRRRPNSPEVQYVRSFSLIPGSPQELERILQRWELALARKAKALLDHDGGET